MSGGVAYVLGSPDAVRRQCNQTSVEVTDPDKDDLAIVQELLQRQAGYTHSRQARQLLAAWTDTAGQLVLVRPRRRGAGVSGVPQRLRDAATETVAALT
jgi:glutamate synthase domain-containing protein 3